ncbi:MAG: DUF192 domain-containing protein [Halobacteriales archaeon]
MADAPGPQQRPEGVRGLRDRLRLPALVLLVLLLVGAGAVAYDEFQSSGDPNAATVTVVDQDGGTLGTVEVTVADTFRERYTGLSEATALGPDEGMLFVHDAEANHSYVMRDMAFPIDIVFIDADRRITAIHHAEVEDPPLTQYSGRAKWVLEVPYNWTTDHGVIVGDRVRIDLGA